MSTSRRKSDHIRVCLGKDVEFLKGNGFERYSLTHNALPETDFAKIDVTTEFLGRRFRAPLFIEAMTGGSEESAKINRNLALAAQELSIPMGIGSQRAMIEKPELAGTFAAKKAAPNIFLVGNIGASHIKEYRPAVIRKALDDIDADAVAVHLNPAQEAAQEGGHLDWTGVLDALKKFTEDIGKPVIVKEVGSGISGDVAKKLEKAGAAAIDVAGAGGTSWVKVDSLIGNTPYESFYEWGIPTAESLEQCLKSVRIPLIASGGIRNGVDAAKALSMGASMVGMALPLLKPAAESPEAVKKVLEKVISELKTAMLLTSSRNLSELRGKAVKI